MKVKVHFKDSIEVEIPESFLKAWDEAHFRKMLLFKVQEALDAGGFYQINASDLEDCIKYYRQFKRKL